MLVVHLLITSSSVHLPPFRLINPVVVSPTIAAVGLSFYSYGFPRVGTCLEIGAVQILLVIIFSLVSSSLLGFCSKILSFFCGIIIVYLLSLLKKL